MLPFTGELITIKPGDDPETINKLLYGINVSGMFESTTLPEGEIWTEQQWQWLSDLKPDILRFPTGDRSEFCRLLYNADGTESVGYGLDIEEIYKYYDKTDDEHEPQILDDIIDATDTELETWMLKKYVQIFINFRDKYKAQEFLDYRYIDAFIRLVKKIETDNPGHRVKVVLCLNITTESAARCKEIVQYLRNTITNEENYALLVEGVEMGNEYADKFHCNVMGMSNFQAYYDYLFGVNNDEMDELNTVYGVSNEIYNGHDFMNLFKGTPHLFSCKVGLVAAQHDSESGYVFRLSADDDDDCILSPATTWNTDMKNKYADRYPLGSSSPKPKTFDAVILHNYYTADNYYTIPLDELADTYYTDAWDYGFYDTDLFGAFDGSITEGIKKNFRNFMRNGYLDAFDAYNTNLGFNLSASLGKALWTTEGVNIKDEKKPEPGEPELSDLKKLEIASYTNSFMHGSLTQEWFLKNIKINFQSPYRKNFYTISTIQNYAGGAQTAMLTPADNTEIYTLDLEGYFDALGINPNIFDEETNWYVKRTPMFAYELAGDINKNSLDYLPSTFTLSKTNINLQPTVFITPAENFLFIYYSNVKNEEQNYLLDFSTLKNLYPGATDVYAGPYTVYGVEAQQCYSSAGKSALFEINTDYTSAGGTEHHPFEIRSLITPYYGTSGDCDNPVAEAEGRCLKAEANSYGYFLIPVTPALERNADAVQNIQFNIYPNPASSHIVVTGNTKIYSIQICSLTGEAVQSLNGSNIVDVSMLVRGMYIVKVNEEYYNKITLQ